MSHTIAKHSVGFRVIQFGNACGILGIERRVPLFVKYLHFLQNLLVLFFPVGLLFLGFLRQAGLGKDGQQQHGRKYRSHFQTPGSFMRYKCKQRSQ